MNTKMTGGRKEFAIVHSRDVVENPVRKIVFSKSGSILQKSPESADRKDGSRSASGCGYRKFRTSRRPPDSPLTHNIHHTDYELHP